MTEKAEKKILNLLKESKHYFINGFLELLSKATELTWKRAEPKNAFHAYNENLELLLDIFMNLEIKNAPPALIEMLTYNLNRVANYIGTAPGDSHTAFRTWEKRKGDLSADIIKEVKNISRSRHYYSLKELLDGIDK